LCSGKFHFCCGTAGSYIFVAQNTAFSGYAFHYIYACPGSVYVSEKYNNEAWACV